MDQKGTCKSQTSHSNSPLPAGGVESKEQKVATTKTVIVSKVESLFKSCHTKHFEVLNKLNKCLTECLDEVAKCEKRPTQVCFHDAMIENGTSKTYSHKDERSFKSNNFNSSNSDCSNLSANQSTTIKRNLQKSMHQQQPKQKQAKKTKLMVKLAPPRSLATRLQQQATPARRGIQVSKFTVSQKRDLSTSRNDEPHNVNDTHDDCKDEMNLINNSTTSSSTAGVGTGANVSSDLSSEAASPIPAQTTATATTTTTSTTITPSTTTTTPASTPKPKVTLNSSSYYSSSLNPGTSKSSVYIGTGKEIGFFGRPRKDTLVHDPRHPMSIEEVVGCELHWRGLKIAARVSERPESGELIEHFEIWKFHKAARELKRYFSSMASTEFAKFSRKERLKKFLQEVMSYNSDEEEDESQL